ncbi:MAG: nitrite reductase [Gemmataceae bacterium]|nr:nitrite reductase [Gemmataceae bacterium]
MPDLHRVCPLSELPEGEVRSVEVHDRVVAVFHHQGNYFAVDDFCPHQGASLSGGHVENGCVTCPWHAWRFHLADGAWADNPKLKIRCYGIVQKDGDLFLELSPPANTNPI